MPAKVRILIATLLFGLMGTIGIYSYRSAHNYRNASEWVNHSQQVIAETNSVLSGVQNIVITERGYVITGDSSYITSYRSAVENVQNKYFIIRNLVQDNPGQQALLDSINILVAAKIRFAEQVINARSHVDFESSQKLILSREGENLMKQITDLLNVFTLKERNLLAQRLDRANKNYTWAVMLIITGVALTLFIILISYYLFTRDYKHRLKTEKQLRESELLMKKFLNSIPLGILILGKDGKLYFSNDKSEEMIGKGRIGALGKGLMSNASSENSPEVNSIVKAETNEKYPPEKLPLVRALNGEKNVVVDDMEVQREPKNIPLRVNATSVVNAEGEVEYAISIFEDITTLKETNKKIKESEEKFYKAFAISPVAFAISDTLTGTYIDVNESFATITGYTKSELIGRNSVEVGIIVDQASREKILKNIQQNGNIRDVELTIRNKNGDLIDMLTSAETLMLQGRKCTLSINYDITSLKESERALQEASKLAQESVMLKETFLANMSHEIRTPMNAIIGFTELLLKRELNKKERDYVELIKASGENLLRIINDILDVSKIESGMMIFEENPISIKELFYSLQNMFLPRATDKGLLLSFEYPPDLPDTVIGDPTRLTQIIINLVGNALKFTEKGTVAATVKVLKEETEQYTIEFSVKDTGVGIPEDKLKYIFERFRQADSHTTRHYGGTGLGLSIAKQLIELQGGEIHVRSIDGIGSEFIFSLSFKKAQIAVEKNKKAPSKINVEELNKLNILMVEDNPINIKFIQSLFEEHSIHADIAINGKDAIEKFAQKKYDLVLMDIEMPEMNGYETTFIIRDDYKSDVPIIAMTANAMAGEKDKCLKVGMNDYIAKPIKSDILFEKMYKAAFEKDIDVKKKYIDLEFLVTSMHGKKNAIRETIDIFIEQMPRDVLLIHGAVDKEDYLSIKHYAHKMKSAASLMGISKMQDTLSELEFLAAEGKDMVKIHTLYLALNLLSEQAINELRKERLNYE